MKKIYARGEYVFVVDSGKENGDITFGIRKFKRIGNNDLRSEYIRRTNNESVSKGFASDGLSAKLGSGHDYDIGRNLRRESGKELQSDQGASKYREGSVLKEDADRGGVRVFFDQLFDELKST